MSLKPCKECHKEVSTSAKQCPHCGSKYPRGFFGLTSKIILGLVAVQVVIGLFATRFAWEPRQSSVDVSPGPTQQTTQAASQTPAKQEPLYVGVNYHSKEKTLIPRSMPGDNGRYYLLEVKNRGGFIRTLHKRVGVDTVGFTVLETNCLTMQMRELAYSLNRPITIDDEDKNDPTTYEWFKLVPGSSKSDLALFVCKER